MYWKAEYTRINIQRSYCAKRDYIVPCVCVCVYNSVVESISAVSRNANFI